MNIDRPNQVWATDICYVPMAIGFVYVAATMDWFSRKILAWRVSGSAWMAKDNVFVERLWCSLKYEEVYFKAYETVAQNRQGMGNYFRFYNRERRHQSLDRQTPDQVYEWSEMWPVAA